MNQLDLGQILLARVAEQVQVGRIGVCVDAFVDVGNGFLDVLQQCLAAVFAFLEADFEGLLALAVLQMTQFLAHYRRQMIGVVQVEEVVGAFLQQAGGLVLLAAFLVHYDDDRNILFGFDHHQA